VIHNLPIPTLKAVHMFQELMETTFSVTLSADEAHHLATKTLQLAYVIDPSLHPIRAQEHRPGRPPGELS
jgi:hypothetical protein